MKIAAIIDDELKLPSLPDDISRVFSDDTSPEYEKLQAFLHASRIISDESAISEFISTSDFISNVVLNDKFVEVFEGDFKISLLAYKNDRARSMEKFALIQKVLRDNGFQVELLCQRPQSNADLERFDVIFMDFYMGDDNDDVDNLSNYLGGIPGDPLIFLISSRTELNDLKIKFRKQAKISSLAFSIFSKDILSQDNSEVKINLILRQMINSIEEASSFKQLILSFEMAHSHSLDKVKDCFWNLDYSFIQKLKSRTDNENNSFSEHLLSLLSHYNNYHLESNEWLCSAINELENILNKKNKLACFSTDSEALSHDLDSSLFLTGRKPKVTTFQEAAEALEAIAAAEKAVAAETEAKEALTEAEEALAAAAGTEAEEEAEKALAEAAVVLTEAAEAATTATESAAKAVAKVIESAVDRETSENNASMDINISDVLPFGSLLVNGENSVLIHCTQQCDLSRNIKRDDINLIFINASIVTERKKIPQSTTYSIIPLPSTIFDKNSLLCINHKKILAIPAGDALKYLSDKQYVNKAILREGAVRQYREKMFDEMSRIETPISSGNFLNVSLKIDRFNSDSIEFKNEDNENRVVLNEFVYDSKSTYHLIEQRNVEVIWWLKSHLDLDTLGLNIYELETILKDRLPAQNKLCDNYTDDKKFIICFDKDKTPQGRDVVLRITSI
ncbi:hypothetical protein K1S81_23925 [Klebsiella pneumoniae]|nr:hypothetical protein [Klebsiella pneumoniae]MCA5482537.1 hypothetical protein [Klebsiella pneumoniae]MCA5541286.1 hypothetical protein [Klebsiella pneumoniae]